MILHYTRPPKFITIPHTRIGYRSIDHLGQKIVFQYRSLYDFKPVSHTKQQVSSADASMRLWSRLVKIGIGINVANITSTATDKKYMIFFNLLHIQSKNYVHHPVTQAAALPYCCENTSLI